MHELNSLPCKRIYIVEDHRMVRQALRLFLERESGLEVCGEAENGTEALQQILDQRPDVVISDISLPGMNGIEFIKNLKAQLPHVIVVVLSMHDESVYAQRALQAGARAYVMKKESAEEVVAAVRHALNGEYHVSKSVLGAIFHKTPGATCNGKQPSASPLPLLTDRELEVFELVGRGKSTREIAGSLRISGKTVETHRSHIKEKCGLRSNSDLVHYATAWVAHSDNGEPAAGFGG